MEQKHATIAYRNTKPCMNVVKTPTGYTTCTRPGCTYAHSLAELAPNPCRYDNKCSKFPACPFKHFRETLREFYERIGQPFPDLPEHSDSPVTVVIPVGLCPEPKSKISITEILQRRAPVKMSDYIPE